MVKFKNSKVIILGIALLALAVVLISTAPFRNQEQAKGSIEGKKTPTYIVSMGSGIAFDNFTQMDAQTGLVVKGKKVGVGKNILTKDSEGLALDNRTLSSFIVEKVLKNENNLNIKEGDQITVQENAAVDGDIVISTMGYQLMNTDEEYLLFLAPNLTQPDVYNISGVFYGKVPIQEATDQNSIQFQGDKKVQEKLQSIFKEAKSKYKN